MHRLFIIEAVSITGKTNAVNAAGQFGKSVATYFTRRPSRIVDGRDRIGREGVQDVGEDQLLVLLLVMKTDLEHAHDR